MVVLLLAGSFLGQAVNGAEAASNNIYFGANLTYDNACTIVLQQDGAFVPNGPATQLSSKLAGGRPGIADIYAMSNYYVTVDALPYFLSGPSGASDNSTFTTTFSGQSIFRGRTFAERPGSNAMRLRGGTSITRVNVHLVVDNPTIFPSGDYTALTIVRCEP